MRTFNLFADLQPDSEVMLADPACPGRPLIDTPCRDVMAIWHQQLYLRLMIAGWWHVSEEGIGNGEAKKPRTE